MWQLTLPSTWSFITVCPMMSIRTGKTMMVPRDSGSLWSPSRTMETSRQFQYVMLLTFPSPSPSPSPTLLQGHVWVFKLASTDQILFEEMIDLHHCGKIMVAPPEHVEALRQYCRDTGRAVLGVRQSPSPSLLAHPHPHPHLQHWPRAPVVREMHPVLPASSESVFTTEHAHFSDDPAKAATQTTLTIRTLSTQPHLLEIENFLSDEECEHLKEIAIESPEFTEHDDDEDLVRWKWRWRCRILMHVCVYVSIGVQWRFDVD